MRTIKHIGDVETLPVDVVIKAPIAENTKLLFNHIGRYVIGARALNISEGDVVVDASCGEGYGTYYLSTLARKVYGLDISTENIEYANKHYKADNMRFLKYFDFLKLRTKADKILCIETFEHIEKDKQPQFVNALRRMLKPNGGLFLTVPIGNDLPSDYNPFHKNEPCLNTIYDLFKSYFKKITIETNVFVNSYGHETRYALITMLEKGNL